MHPTVQPTNRFTRTPSSGLSGRHVAVQVDVFAGMPTFAKRAGYAIVDEFYDAAVKGADPVQERPGFAALLERIRGNGVRTIIVEIANWLARDLRNPGLGHLPSETLS